MDTAEMTVANIELFGEAITYTKSSGATRAITGIVNRNPVSPVPEAMDTARPLFHVTVLNNATTGILFTELDLGGDKLSFPNRIGEAAQSHHLSKIADQCPDAMVLEI